MFGLLKKKPPPGSFILVAVKSALFLRANEKDNGGIYSTPEAIRITTDSLANQMGVDMNSNVKNLTYACVMALLMEQKFIDRLISRAMKGPMGTLTKEDEEDIFRITKHLIESQ